MFIKKNSHVLHHSDPTKYIIVKSSITVSFLFSSHHLCYTVGIVFKYKVSIPFIYLTQIDRIVIQQSEFKLKRGENAEDPGSEGRWVTKIMLSCVCLGLSTKGHPVRIPHTYCCWTVGVRWKGKVRGRTLWHLWCA